MNVSHNLLEKNETPRKLSGGNGKMNDIYFKRSNINQPKIQPYKLLVEYLVLCMRSRVILN